jgi:uncharacterized protein (TIGR03382 family)
MTNMKKLLMFAVAGLLAPSAANAEVRTATFAKIIPAPLNDKAPVSGTPARLKRTNEEQAGGEMPTLAMFKDGKSGMFFSMTTELKGVAAKHRVQLSAVPFALTQDATTGAVTATPDMAGAKFVTDNVGNEYRNANHPTAYPILDGELIAVEYNYQPNNSNDTKRYLQVFNKAGAPVMGQTLLFQKNNDDASMCEDGKCSDTITLAPNKARIAGWRGANGNGDDDGWVSIHEVTCDAGLTACTLAKIADLSVCPREERSHGAVTFGTDPNTVIATWTEGNTQPQRDGTWIAAVNVGAGQNGNNAQSRLLWKKQVDGRKDIDGIRTYSMRAMQSRILTVDSATGKLAKTDKIIWRSGDLRGNNNGNNGKGGTYYHMQMGVIEATAAGMKYITPLTDVAPDLVGLDGTHLGMAFALFGTTNALVPGITFLSGSQTGGGSSAQVRAVTWDAATNKFASAGMQPIAPYDRHLYPNYLGNNPGNQGRNYANGKMIANPFVGTANNTDAHLMIFATTGKAPEDMTKPEIKLSQYISIVPVTQTPVASGGGTGAGTGTGTGTGSGSGSGTPADPTTEAPADEAGTSLGGCSTTGSTGGAASFLLIGLAALIRRRRS